MNPVFTMKGVQVQLEVFEDKLTLTPRGVLGLLGKGTQGTKTIYFTSITAIQFKKSGLTSGYLQFTLAGWLESKKGVFEAAQDENTFMFAGDNASAEKIKQYIETQVQKAHQPQLVSTGSVADELNKLLQLKDQGILTAEEFAAAKKKLLG